MAALVSGTAAVAAATNSNTEKRVMGPTRMTQVFQDFLLKELLHAKHLEQAIVPMEMEFITRLFQNFLAFFFGCGGRRGGGSSRSHPTLFFMCCLGEYNISTMYYA